MKLRLFFASTFAAFDSAGRLTVYDADIEEIRAPSFPKSIDQLYLVVKLLVEEHEFDKEHFLVVRAFGEKIEGHEEEPIMFIPHRTADGRMASMSCAFYVRLADPLFPKAGAYGFELIVDDQSLGRLELRAIEEKKAHS
jgi:uncharacterized protein DUF6941